jgi:hypothetical protein
MRCQARPRCSAAAKRERRALFTLARLLAMPTNDAARRAGVFPANREKYREFFFFAPFEVE